MSNVDNTDKTAIDTEAEQRAAGQSGPGVNVSRRSVVKAALASGPVIMTVVSRPAGAVSGGSMHSPMDPVVGGEEKDKDKP